jgi:Zn-dependent protease/predicted transcriptional regulator
MRWSWKIGRLAGINVYVHATFLFLIFFILIAHWVEGHSAATALAGIVFVLLIFACVVLHELGHALTGRHYGIRTRDIILLPIGGVARLERMPEQPKQELWVALAGPAVNIVIAAGLFGFLTLLGMRLELGRLNWASGNFLVRLMVVNLWLAGFNLLPAFPMDGGRVLRALLATRIDYIRATQIAAHVGQAMALLFGFAGLFGNPMLLFIALFVWMGAEAEAAMVQIHTSIARIPVQQVMLTEFQTLRPDDTLGRAVELILAGFQQDFPVVYGDRVLGVVTREGLMRALAQQGAVVPVREAMQRDFRTVDSHDMLEQALSVLHSCHCRALPVQHEGRLVGMLNTENVGEFMMIQAALRQAQMRGERTVTPAATP